MSRAKSLLALLIVAAVVALALLPRGRGPADEATSVVSITLTGYDDDANPGWKIRAADGRIDGPAQTLDDVSVEFYDEASTLGLRGDRLERSEGVARLSGGVRIERADDDLVLETEALTWIEADERLEAGPIALSADVLRLSAERFGYDLGAGTASFTDVEAFVDLETDWTIHGDHAEERDGVVTFRGGVVAESEGGESFRCERLEVDSATEAVRLVGDVRGGWPAGDLTADSVRWDEDGTRASGRVEARLDLEEMGASDDT